MKTFWLSFADDEGFRGAIIAEAESFEEAIQESWRRQCNPGGEVMGVEFDVTADDSGWAKNAPRYKLMSREEIESPVRVKLNDYGTLSRYEIDQNGDNQ